MKIRAEWWLGHLKKKTETCVLVRGHLCPGWATFLSKLEKNFCPGSKINLSWLDDISVLAGIHFCPGWKTFLLWLEHISVLDKEHFCTG